MSAPLTPSALQAPPEASLLTLAWVILAFQFGRYALGAGGAFLLVQRWTPTWLERRRIAPRRAESRQIRRELGTSLLSITLFMAIALGIRWLRERGIVHLCADLECHGWVWSIASVAVLLVVHDTWFYWTHRLLHHPAAFRFWHRTHHLSHDPTPLAAFAFHPVEAVIEAGFLPLTLLVMPIHPASIVAFQIVAFAINVYGHLGIELLPVSFASHRGFRWINTTSHHHQHHRAVTANFGLYFNWWDRICGTNHPDYAATFIRNATGRPG
jgi:sterol desaturase/sphingolipid hydroxylase (fatty acid hydroxylase superfamily)